MGKHTIAGTGFKAIETSNLSSIQTGHLRSPEAEKTAARTAQEKNLKVFSFDVKIGRSSSTLKAACMETYKITEQHPQFVRKIPDTPFAIITSQRVA